MSFHVGLIARTLLTLTIVASYQSLPAAAPAGEFIWIEAEQPTKTNLQPKLAGWGRTEFLSDGNWLSYSVEADKVEATVPGDGVLMEYDLKAHQAAKYEVWTRIGFEFARSPFAWRIDEQDWATVSPDDLTTDLMEVGQWCEVAWFKLGEQQLSAGQHKLTIKLPKTKDAKGKTARILFACDAFCLSAGPFYPNSKFKPNEDGRTAADRQAAAHVFKLPPAKPAERSAVTLTGVWEVCRHDEQLPGEVAAPITDFPAQPIWKAIPVPGDKNVLRPDLLFAHRLWYRTKVDVPAASARSYHLVFPQNNLITTVTVNGTLCGFNKTPFARFDIDVTKAIKPGVNEICVGIKDAWYGYSANPAKPLKLRKRWNLPLSFSHQGFQDLAYPIWNHFQSGILGAPEFVSAGSVKAADVFCKPSVAKQELVVDVTLRNTTGQPATGEVVCEAIDSQNKVAKTFAATPFTVAAGAEQVITTGAKWDNAKLWWPDEPNLYTLRTTVKLNGQPTDISDTTFGFREWTTAGKDFKLNGIVWHGWADCFTAKSPEEWLAFYRHSNQRMMRFWGVTWQNLPPEQALKIFDREGVVVRRSGILDGEAIGYFAIENDPDFKKVSEIKLDLMRNWQDQVTAQVKGERNHPSVMVWSLENEWLFINCINLYGGLMDKFEAEVLKVSDAVRAIDPTRPTMTDGGGANRDNSMPVCGNHYVYGDPPRYPDLAYEVNAKGGGRNRWEWNQQQPRFIGEDFFANGINPFDYAYFGGEETFQGKAQSHRAAGIIFRMLTEGYRWAEYGAWHFWMNQNEANDQYNSNAPRAVFCRQWDWTFAAGAKVKRNLRVFNDTRFNDPLTLKWELTIGGQKIAGASQTLTVPPGGSLPLEIVLPLPEVKQRSEGELVLTLVSQQTQVFEDRKPVSVLNTDFSTNKPAALTSVKAADLLVFDPHGAVQSFLTRNRIPFTPLKNLTVLPDGGKTLLLGKDALAANECDSTKFQAFAATGRTVIVLEQKSPLKYQALPAGLEPAQNEGRTAFVEDLEHPVFAGLQQKDFFTWAGDHVVYRDAYLKPTHGGKSLVQCDIRLKNTALCEVPAGRGLLLLSQLVIGEKLAESAAAQQLLTNLLAYAVSYHQEFRPVAVCTKDLHPALAKELDAIKLKYNTAADPLATLAASGAKTVVIPASPGNLKTLAGNLAKVNEFTAAGGQILFHDLTPEGLADYNKVVGYDHILRPFWRERVTFPAKRNPLLAGLSTGDIVMRSGERIFGWTSDEYVANDIFTYIVDYDDVAAFAKFPNEFLKNMVNGMVTADAWKYIVNQEIVDDKPLEWTLQLPREEEIVGVDWIGNTIYYPITKVQLIFDGQEDKPVTLTTKPTNELQNLPVEPPRKGTKITLRLAEWEKVADKRPVTGLDNIWLRAKRSPDFLKNVRPMLNVGGLVQYARGSGGIVLCNVRFQDHEAVPENAIKKRTILAAILRNLKAPFAEGKTIIAGAPLKYEPLDISKQCTTYRDDRGWFGDKKFTFQGLPSGKQTFAGVPFEIYEFPTSPVPTVIMLNGPRVPGKLPEAVPGIPVGRKADALFFLHTARLDQRMNPRDIKEKKQYELLRYVITYADGQTAELPIYAEIDIDDFKQAAPRVIPGAQLAWVRPFENTDQSAVAYSKQWNNPRPNVEIKSIDMVYGKDKRGVPVLIAVTAASAQ